MLRVERITSEKFEGMAAEWEELHSASARMSFFQNWHWLNAWWKTFQRSRSLFVLTFREGNDLVGIAPFFQENTRHWSGVCYNTLRFLGTEKVNTDHLDFLYRVGRERALANEFLNYLELYAQNWDILQLSDYADDSHFMGILQAEAIAGGLAVLPRRTTKICPYISLPEDITAFYDRFNSTFRIGIRKSIRQLHERGFRLQVVTRSQNYCQAFEETVRLQTLRWQSNLTSGNLANPRVLDFHRLLLSSNAKYWQPRFFLLLNSERIIAALYGFLYGDKLIYYQSGDDPAYAKYSPATSLIAMVIEYAIDQCVHEFDYTEKDGAEKFEWAPEFRRTVSYSIFQRKPKCGIQLILDYALQEIKRQMKRQNIPRPQLDSVRDTTNLENKRDATSGDRVGKEEHSASSETHF